MGGGLPVRCKPGQGLQVQARLDPELQGNRLTADSALLRHLGLVATLKSQWVERLNRGT